jgi:hypothetical protein
MKGGVCMMCHYATVYIGCRFWELAQIGGQWSTYKERESLPDLEPAIPALYCTKPGIRN